MSPWVVIWTYWGALAVMTLGLTVKGPPPMRRTIWTLLAVCVIQFLFATYVAGTETEAHAIFMFGVDALAAFNILRHPAAKWQSLIGAAFVLQLGMHIGRLAANNPDMNFYFAGLSVTAFVQLFLVGGWWLDERGLLPRRLGRYLPAFARRREGVE
jgi:hypothetical protein